MWNLGGKGRGRVIGINRGTRTEGLSRKKEGDRGIQAERQQRRKRERWRDQVKERRDLESRKKPSYRKSGTDKLWKGSTGNKRRRTGKTQGAKLYPPDIPGPRAHPPSKWGEIGLCRHQPTTAEQFPREKRALEVDKRWSMGKEMRAQKKRGSF